MKITLEEGRLVLTPEDDDERSTLKAVDLSASFKDWKYLNISFDQYPPGAGVTTFISRRVEAIPSAEEPRLAFLTQNQYTTPSSEAPAPSSQQAPESPKECLG